MERKKLDKEFMKVEEPRRPLFQDKINSIDGKLEEFEKQNATISRKVNKRLTDMQRRGSFIGAISNFRLNSKVDKIKSLMSEHQPKVKVIEDSILVCLGTVIEEKDTCLIRVGEIMCDLEIQIKHYQCSVHEFDNFINDIQECDCSVLGELRDLSCSLAFYLEVQQGSKGITAQQLLAPPQCCDDSYDQIMINVKSKEVKEIKVNTVTTRFGNRTSGCDTKVGDSSSKVDDCCKAAKMHQATSDYKRRSLQHSSISVTGLNLCPLPLDSKADQKTAMRSSGTSAMMVQESKYSISFLHSRNSSVCDQGVGIGSKGSKDSCMLGAIKSRLGASSKSSPDEQQAPLPSSAPFRTIGFPSLSEYHRRRTDSTNSTLSNTDRSLSCSSSTTTPSAALTLTSSVAFKPDKSHRDYLEFRYALLFEFIPELQQLKGQGQDCFSTLYHSDSVFKNLVRHLRKCLRFKEVLNSCLLAVETEQDAKTKQLRRIKRLRGELETMTMVQAVEDQGKKSSVGQLHPADLSALDLAVAPHHSSESCSTLSCSLHSHLMLPSLDSSSHGQQQQPPSPSQCSISSSLYDTDFLNNCRLQLIDEKMAVGIVSDADHRRGSGPLPMDESRLQEASACIEQLRSLQQQERALTDRLLRVQVLLSNNDQLDRQVSQSVS
jgi:hypothetical protein